VPEIEGVTQLGTALTAAGENAFKVMMWEGARQQGLREVLPTQRPKRIVIATGPEGGFALDEVEAARAAGFAVVGLGPRILRTETAAMVTLAILGFALGDLG
jgi:16S rRNA (uracil1498-N3)-methyltransferase